MESIKLDAQTVQDRKTQRAVSIVVPTYNEAAGLEQLVVKIFDALRGAGMENDVELIIVDDNSPDGTGPVADELAKRYPLRVLHRSGKLGLASAVIDGFKLTRAPILGVMDADLSHPPSAVPKLITAIRDHGVDLAIGSRYVPGGGMEDWPWTRQFVSWFANVLARPVTSVRDATSGFLLFRREVIEGVKLNPIGFKIGLEVIARGKYKQYEEVPYIFTDRKLGKSKFGSKQVREYLQQLGQLMTDPKRRRR
jgi:dolichol-phosphate mannosyltransferase